MNSIYKHFKTINWNSYDERSKIRLLQEVEIKQAERQNRKPVPVKFEKMPDNHLGSYSPQKEKIILNESLLYNNYFALETVIHEGHHRKQHMLTKGDTKVLDFLNDRPDLIRKTKEEWTDNMKNYSSNLSYETYYLQAIEVDAVESAYADMLRIDELYHENDYQNFLTNRRQYIDKIHRDAVKKYGIDYQETVNQLRELENNMPERAQALEKDYTQRQKAYEKGESIDEYQLVQNRTDTRSR